MSTEKLSPRQQMIGLMYLVLLAMLAMNASKDLLNAFIDLEKGIGLTNDNLESGNLTVLQKIQSSALLGSEKAKFALKQAKEISLQSQDLSQLIKQYKKDIIEMGGGIEEETGIPLGKDNQDVGAEYLIVNKKGAELRAKIEAYKQILVGAIDPKDSTVIASISQILATPEYEDYEGNKASWEAGISEHMPLVAVTANLANLETYVQNAETQVLSYLYEGIGLDTYKVNKILATSISDKSYVLQGEDYEANVFLAAADTTQEPIILVGAYDKELFASTGEVRFLGKVDTLDVKGGKGKYTLKANEVGVHQWEGIMKVPHPNPKRKGEYLMYPFENNYTVAAPTAVISSEQLNIMYLGLDNEINVSAPGISSDKLEVRASNNCSVRKKADGKYIFKPSRTGKTEILVYVKEGEETKLISKQSWTGKRLPKPELTHLSKVFEGYVTKGQLLVQAGNKFIPAYSPDFPLNGKLTIVECTIDISLSNNYTGPKKIQNGVYDNDIKEIIKRMRPGDEVEVLMRVIDQSGVSHKLIGRAKIR